MLLCDFLGSTPAPENLGLRYSSGVECLPSKSVLLAFITGLERKKKNRKKEMREGGRERGKSKL